MCGPKKYDINFIQNLCLRALSADANTNPNYEFKSKYHRSIYRNQTLNLTILFLNLKYQIQVKYFEIKLVKLDGYDTVE